MGRLKNILRNFTMAICFLCTTNGFTQEPELSTPDLYFAALIVNDMDKSLNWYRDVLGFKLVNSNENAAKGFKQANLVNGHAKLELLELGNSVKKEQVRNLTGNDSRVDGIFKIGMRVADFDAWIAHLRANQTTFSGNVVTDPLTQKKMVIALDPEGNRIQFFER